MIIFNQRRNKWRINVKDANINGSQEANKNQKLAQLVNLIVGIKKMKRIPLTQGKFALIDDEDYHIILLFKWYLRKDCNTFYALTNIATDNKRASL